MKKTTSKAKTTKETRVKKINLAVLLVLAAFAVVIGIFITKLSASASTSEPDSNSYDNTFFSNAKERTCLLEIDFENNSFYTPECGFEILEEKEISDGVEFVVQEFGEETNIPIHVLGADGELRFIDVEDVTDKEIEKYITNSKKYILQYIEQSTILKNKQELMDYITNEMKVKVATVIDPDTGEDNRVVASANNSYIYLNNRYLDDLDDATLVHEMLHVLSNHIRGSEPTYLQLDEAITDMITEAIIPSMHEDLVKQGKIISTNSYYQMMPELYKDLWPDPKFYKSCYDHYYLYTSPLIDICGEKILEGYFYGFENVYKDSEIISKEEFDLFATTYNLMEDDSIYILYAKLLCKWHYNLGEPIPNTVGEPVG